MNQVDLVFGGLANALDSHRTPQDKAFGGENAFTDRGVLQGGPRYGQIGHRPGATGADVAWGMGYARRDQNAVFKLEMDTAATGGTIKLVHNGPTSGAALADPTAAIAYDADAATIQSKLEATTDLTPGDVNVYAGPWPGLAVYLEYKGQYRATDMRAPSTSDNLLTPSGSVTVTEFKTGGSFEVVYVVIQPDGTGDATLYAVTSADDWETTTWTSIATTLDPSDWQILQYDDKVLLLNATDGLKWLHVGHDTLSADPPNPPTRAPVITKANDSVADIVWPTGTYTDNNFLTSPTYSTFGNMLRATLNNTESGRTVWIRATKSPDSDLSKRDFYRVAVFVNKGTGASVPRLDPNSITFKMVNSDGSPATISPLAKVYVNETAQTDGYSYAIWVQFGGNDRDLRENIDKLELDFTFAVGVTNNTVDIYTEAGWNWMNDEQSMALPPTVEKINYKYAYYRSSDETESKLSPLGESPTTPSVESGSNLFVSGYTSQELGASDRIFIYRQHPTTKKWHRIPNKYTKPFDMLLPSDFGITNNTTPGWESMLDILQQYELESLPEQSNSGFPPQDTDVEADVMAIWKQCLGVGADRKLWLSAPGQPLKFAPSPDEGDPDIDIDDEERPSTEYVADNRAEQVYGIVGNDSLYIVTSDSAYTKIGDKPSDATVCRRLPGSRGAIAKRAVGPLGGGLMMLSHDGAWYYSVGRGFSGEDNGNLTERELTQTVRKSYFDLFNTVQSITCDVGGRFLLTLSGYGQTQVYIEDDDTSDDIEEALLTIPGLNYGDVECWGGPLSEGPVYVRFRGQFQGEDVALMTVDTTNVEGPAPAVEVLKVSEGGTHTPMIFEFKNELWMVNGKRFLRNTSEQTWLQGTWSHKMKAHIVNRRIGVLFLTSTGRLMKVADKHTSDAGEEVTWVYETGITRMVRAKIRNITLETRGTPTVEITTWDGINGRHTDAQTATENGWWLMGMEMKPGTKYRIRITGVVGRDEVKTLQMLVEPTMIKGVRT